MRAVLGTVADQGVRDTLFGDGTEELPHLADSVPTEQGVLIRFVAALNNIVTH